MTIKLYNTLTRDKEEFMPMREGKVGIYVCGVTVWDSTHLGHGRSATVFDLLVRFLRFRGYEVTYVKNYTDVDDKIIKRANEEGSAWNEVAEKYIAEYAADMRAMGNLPPDLEPKASEHIPEMVAIIETLIERGMAYEANGDVFYAVRKFDDYGQLSGKKIEELEVGARIEANQDKRDPLDFVLWKAVKPGEPSWPSPWGDGRPGWHIECSAMSKKHLGQPFDIHGGGCDLVFPHHENEIAQSEGLGEGKFARCWVHHGSLTIDSEKMSKSLGNYFKTSEALSRYDHEVLRHFLLSCHYRSPLNFSEEALKESQRALERIYEVTARLGISSKTAGNAPTISTKKEKDVVAALQTLPTQVSDAMADDLNTAMAFGFVFEAVRTINRYLDTNPEKESACYAWVAQAWSIARAQCGELFGILASDPADFRARCEAKSLADRQVDRGAIEQLVNARLDARKARDFAKADKLRDQLAAMGVILKDRPDGTCDWQIKE